MPRGVHEFRVVTREIVDLRRQPVLHHSVPSASWLLRHVRRNRVDVQQYIVQLLSSVSFRLLGS